MSRVLCVKCTYGVRLEDGGDLAILAAEAAARRLRRRRLAVLRARAPRLPHAGAQVQELRTQ